MTLRLPYFPKFARDFQKFARDFQKFSRDFQKIAREEKVSPLG